jgi:adenylate kinase
MEEWFVLTSLAGRWYRKPLRMARRENHQQMGHHSPVSYQTAYQETWPVDLQTDPGRILLLGPPGVGKGTQAREMERLWGIPHISTGDLLRSHVNRGTSPGRLAQEIMKRGELVPDSLVCEIVFARLQEPDTFRGCIFDGFPRTLGQAVWLERRLAEYGPGNSIIAVGIRMTHEHLLRRITGRRICPLCQTTYNVYLNPPKRAGLCDKDSTALVQRTDDAEQVFEQRVRNYEMLTAPVVEHYRTLGRFVSVDGTRSIEEIAAEIVGAVVRIRQQGAGKSRT